MKVYKRSVVISTIRWCSRYIWSRCRSTWIYCLGWRWWSF